MPFGKAPKRLDRNALEHYASAQLAQRPLSTNDLRRKLVQRAEDPTDVDPILTKLTEYGALNDARYAEAFSQSRKQNRLLGKERVLRDLATKRIPSALAKEAVAETYANTDECVLIEDFLTRKFRGKSLGEFLKDQKNFASAFRRLRTAGYSTANSLKVLRRYSSLADSVDPSDD